MTPGEGAGLCLALASAGCLNWGFFRQHGAASKLPALSARRPVASLRILFTNLSWLAGFVVGLAGWALYARAASRAALARPGSLGRRHRPPGAPGRTHHRGSARPP